MVHIIYRYLRDVGNWYKYLRVVRRYHEKPGQILCVLILYGSLVTHP